VKKFKTLIVWVSLVVAFLVLYALVNIRQDGPRVPFAAFLRDVEENRVAQIQVDGMDIIVWRSDSGGKYRTYGPVAPNLVRNLTEHNVAVTYGRESGGMQTALLVGVPIVLLLGLLVFFLRRTQGNQTNIFSLSKSRARLVDRNLKVTFDDVGGCAAAKEQLGDVIDFLKHPQHWISAGARIPRGVLLEGPPGSGKTLLARAVAGETNAKFFTVSASEFVEMFVGVGAARVRDMFETAVKQAPSVIFIDELDAVGRRRGSGIGSGHDEREQTLNQLLVCLDGFQRNQQVAVIAATNRPDILDKALLRPGRIDRRIKIPEMGRAERLATLQIHTRDKRLAPDVSLEELSDATEEYNGAQLEHLANEAAILAVRRARNSNGQPVSVGMHDFQTVLKTTRAKSSLFNKLDAVLIESTTQLAEPTGKAVVRITLDENRSVVGEVVWVDAQFIKIRVPGENRTESIVPKHQIQTIEVLEGTDAAERDDLVVDPWANRQTGMA
jgi:cell division protease FtsH